MPTTIKSYLLSFALVYAEIWDFHLSVFQGPIFNCKKQSLMAVADNKIRTFQSAGLHTNTHNSLSSSNFITLFSSRFLSKATPSGFKTRLVFTVWILTGILPSALWLHTVNQFKKVKILDDFVWKVTSSVGSSNGSFKTHSGGWANVRQNHPEIFIWDESYHEEKFNIFQYMEEYMELISYIQTYRIDCFLVFPLAPLIQRSSSNSKQWDGIHFCGW